VNPWAGVSSVLAAALAGALAAAALAACGGARPHQDVQVNDRSACEVDIEVSGVPCEANCPLVEQALSGVDGVTGVHMDFATKMASVSAVHPACGGDGFDEMIGALEDAGFGGSIAATR
jgi:copper chaperone CopZ